MSTYYSQKIEIRKKKLGGTFSSTAITLTDFSNLQVSLGIGKRKNTFSFDIVLSKNNIFETYHSGDGVTTDFTLKYDPIDSEFVSGDNKKVFVYVDGVAQSYGASNDYTISGSTLSFNSAPASGVDNIKVVFPVIESGDLVRIYKAKNTSTLNNNHILIEGTVETPRLELDSGSGGRLNVKGVDIIENIFSALVFVKDTSITTPEAIIQDCITQINNYNRLRRIYGENSTEWSNIGNDTTSADIQYVSSYKSALEVIEEVSSDRYTKQGNYYYYVLYNATDDRYEFYWKAKTQSLSSGVSIIEGENGLKELTVEKDNSEIINAVVYNVGLDCYEVPQEFLNYAQTSMVGHGAKWKYILATNTIISDLLNQEFKADPSLWDTGASRNRISNFPTDTSSWTFQFETRNDDGTKTGTNATASSDSEFNDAIVEEARWLGKEATDHILDLKQAPRIKAEATYPFTTLFTLGDLVPVTSSKYNLKDYPLRVVEIKHTDKDTTLYLEEDEFTAIERLISGS